MPAGFGIAVRPEDFNFELPKSAIALRPASPRDAARLLVVDGSRTPPFTDAHVRDLPAFLRPGDVVVLNDTKVLTCVLKGTRPPRSRGAPAVDVELLLVERLGEKAWKALARPARRLRPGDVIKLDAEDRQAELSVREIGANGEIALTPAGSASIEALMARYGRMPLPPYIARSRAPDERDLSDYQTTFAKAAGAVAAPTAGLHFTPTLLARIGDAGATIVSLTLHVGLGTFLPLKEDADLSSHRLHEEWCALSEEAAAAINAARAEGGRIVAVGTTSLRALETAAQDDGTVTPFRGKTDLFIRPGHVFRSADLLVTNFHLPKSTLFMLVCAFSGTALMKQAYEHAKASGYRFYSYGDACLLYRAETGRAP